MANLEEIKSSLNSNSALTEDIKNSIMELVVTFNNAFPGVDLSNLSERLKTLKIIRGSQFLIKGTSRYNPIDNELLISFVKINNCDCKHVLMREILNIITAKDNYTGFNQDNIFEALNVGYTEMLANFLVGNDTNEYEDEVIATNMICKIVGEDKMYEAYFTNNAKLLMNEVY